MQFTVEWLEAFQRLNHSTRKQVLAKLKDLEKAESWPHQALKGDRFKGLYKLRVGDYRLIYQIRDGELLDFIFLGPHREVYQ